MYFKITLLSLTISDFKLLTNEKIGLWFIKIGQL